MSESRSRCIICCSSRIARAFELGRYQIIRCRVCGFRWPEPLPSADEVLQFYRECHHPTAVCDTINLPERESVIRTIRVMRPKAVKLLDVGCGFGHYLDVARKYGFQTFGVEPDTARAAETTKKGHSVFVGPLSSSSFEGALFDVIILNHVVEHLRSPQEVVREIREHLKEDGLLYIATPNFGGLICTVEGSHYTHFTPPEHIAYFTRTSLKVLLENCGFYLIKERRFTHYLNTYDLLAYLFKFKFLKKAKYRDPWKEKSVTPYHRGKFPIAGAVKYTLALAASKLSAPVISAFTTEQLQMFWRKRP